MKQKCDKMVMKHEKMHMRKAEPNGLDMSILGVLDYFGHDPYGTGTRNHWMVYEQISIQL